LVVPNFARVAFATGSAVVDATSRWRKYWFSMKRRVVALAT